MQATVMLSVLKSHIESPIEQVSNGSWVDGERPFENACSVNSVYSRFRSGGAAELIVSAEPVPSDPFEWIGGHRSQVLGATAPAVVISALGEWHSRRQEQRITAIDRDRLSYRVIATPVLSAGGLAQYPIDGAVESEQLFRLVAFNWLLSARSANREPAENHH
jgi:hypothetical protein